MVDLSYTNRDGAFANNTKFIVVEKADEPEKIIETLEVAEIPEDIEAPEVVEEVVEIKKPRKKKVETEE